MSVMRSSVTLARFTVKSPLSVPNTYTCPLTTSDSGTTSARQPFGSTRFIDSPDTRRKNAFG